ncbi:MAG: hypothetical protein E7254_07610 [Lachnospiraceae bacterium]|nr:hypothetical protein [Lachnospiraceae bacterium]
MLLFSTLLSINGSMSKDDFIELVIKWNQGSPHESNIVKDINWNGEHNIKFGDAYLWIEIFEYKNIIAVRHEKTEEDGTKWDTDFIMNFDEMKMAIRLDRSFKEDSLKINAKFSTPHFITMLIESGYLRKDKKLNITNKPLEISDDNMDMLISMINKEVYYKLPIVYISKTFKNELPLDVGLLASKLKGVAHVFVQSDVALNQLIREKTNDQNEYNGAVGIYFPNDSINHSRFLYRTYTGSDDVLIRKIVELIVQYSNAQRIDSLYTWQGVKNALLTEKLSNKEKENRISEDERKRTLYELLELKDNLSQKEETMKKTALEEAKAEVDALLEGVDEEIANYQKQIEKLSQDLEKLEWENTGLKIKLSENTKEPILFMGDEDEFYPGEIKDLILSSLKEFSKKLEAQTRRFDVIKDIIDSNDYLAISEKRSEEVKVLLKNYDGMTSRVKKGLEDIGFVVEHDRNHYKTKYYGDDRYLIVHGATPGDSRSGKNNVSNIIKKVF